MTDPLRVRVLKVMVHDGKPPSGDAPDAASSRTADNHDGAQDAKALARQALENPHAARSDRELGSPPPTAPSPEPKQREGEAEPALSPADLEAADLVELYFELEEPDERDALFDELVNIDSPVVVDFLASMMEEDEDEYIRAAAACELAKRGHGGGQSFLEDQLNEPDEPYLFELAAQTLAEIRGPAFYDTLHVIWRDPERSPDERREAMLGMELLTTDRALDDLVAFVDDIEDVAAMVEEQELVEAAMMAFTRHGHTPAARALRELRDRLLLSIDAEPEASNELADLVSQGLALLPDQTGDNRGEDEGS